MSPDRFEHLLSLVEHKITTEDTRFSKSIPAAERLAITLKFLATGDAQQSLSYSFRIGKTTVSNITLKEETFAVSRFLAKSAKVYSLEIFQKTSSAKVYSREIF